MGHILDKIVFEKRKEIAAKKKLIPVSVFQNSPLFLRKAHSLSQSIRTGSGIIAEFKRRSPSKQVINQKSSVIDVVRAYQDAGASGISVLTDTCFFGGAIDDLIQVRSTVAIPILRKDFMIDSYQIYESKAFGADVILLIAAILTEKEIQFFSKTACDLGMEVLLEIHNEEELGKSDLSCIDLIGVNNRNLKTFEVSLEMSKQLSGIIPDDQIKISESGISSAEAIKELKEYGFKGFLIGENFMKTDDPGKSAAEFLKQL